MLGITQTTTAMTSSMHQKGFLTDRDFNNILRSRIKNEDTYFGLSNSQEMTGKEIIETTILQGSEKYAFTRKIFLDSKDEDPRYPRKTAMKYHVRSTEGQALASLTVTAYQLCDFNEIDSLDQSPVHRAISLANTDIISLHPLSCAPSKVAVLSMAHTSRQFRKKGMMSLLIKVAMMDIKRKTGIEWCLFEVEDILMQGKVQFIKNQGREISEAQSETLKEYWKRFFSKTSNFLQKQFDAEPVIHTNFCIAKNKFN